MKQIIAYLQPSRYPAVSQALHMIEGLLSVSFSPVRGFDADRMSNTEPLTLKELMDYAPFVRVEVFCADDLAYEARCTIETRARTEPGGEGKIFVLEVGQAFHFQADEAKADALSPPATVNGKKWIKLGEPSRP
ncbi:MAG: P-II family nitrogen regulator [Verrucomicrobia bacterium]|nr:P-II family nitrogen regulator [Verrucomicrobiota bacterium]